MNGAGPGHAGLRLAKGNGDTPAERPGPRPGTALAAGVAPTGSAGKTKNPETNLNEEKIEEIDKIKFPA